MFLFLRITPFRHALYQCKDKNEILSIVEKIFGDLINRGNEFLNHKKEKIDLNGILKLVSDEYDENEKLNLFSDQNENAPVNLYIDDKKYIQEVYIHIVELQNKDQN